MPLVAAYHRPTSLDDALALLARPDHVALAGGTVVNADREPSDVQVVDLQALELDGIDRDGDRVHVGATTDLAAVAESELVPDLVRRAAWAEAPSTLRTLATIGGTIAVRSPESVLLAALLVHDTRVALAPTEEVALPDLLATGLEPGTLVVGVSIDPSGEGTWAATGRTPADVPIVAAVARRVGDRIVMALTGVASGPVLVDPDDPTAGLDPTDDFRGSAEYRTELAEVLGSRAREALS